jgi:hypothetical protein
MIYMDPEKISPQTSDSAEVANGTGAGLVLDRLFGPLLRLFYHKPSPQLLSFDEVQTVLKARNEIRRGSRLIPLKAIVGSVGRYRDFNGHFLPVRAPDERWLSIQEATKPLPPIDVYQVGETYYVKDGNHRVSVARSQGQETIAAHVTEIHTDVLITPEMQLEDIIGQARTREFLLQTGLNETRPANGILLTQPDRYDTLLDHIEVHRYYLGQELQRDVSLYEAAGSWFDLVYSPVVGAIRQTGSLREFPKRSEADLYLWVAYHREKLKERYGDMPSDQEVACALVERFSDRPLVGFVKTVTRAIAAAFEAVGESPEPPQTS